MGLGFIDEVNKASWNYPTEQMKKEEFTHRGDYYDLLSMDEGVPDMTEFLWVDQYGRYFIATIVYLEEGKDLMK